LEDDFKAKLDNGEQIIMTMRNHYIMINTDIVWCKMRGYPWWPSRLLLPYMPPIGWQVKDDDVAPVAKGTVARPFPLFFETWVQQRRNAFSLVRFYGDDQITWVKNSDILPFRENCLKCAGVTCPPTHGISGNAAAHDAIVGQKMKIDKKLTPKMKSKLALALRLALQEVAEENKTRGEFARTCKSLRQTNMPAFNSVQLHLSAQVFLPCLAFM
jgi:hypothetical protein